MKKCCGKKRETRFCSDCGKQLINEPIYDLLDHIRKQKGKFISRKKGGKLYSNENVDKYIKKWTDWEKAIEELITNH